MVTTSKKFSLSVGTKLWMVVACAAIGIALLTVISLLSEKSLLLEERKAGVRQAVETAYGILGRYQNLAAQGKMPESEAKQAAADEVRALRYSGSEYFFIIDKDLRAVMHPIKPEMEGRDVSDIKDPTGKRVFVELVSATKENGAGFVLYLWPKPGAEEPVMKASYAKAFAPWGWVIASGVYVDTIDAMFWSRAGRSLVGVTILVGILIAFCAMLVRSITRSLRSAVHLASSVAAGDLSQSFEVDSRDEVGQLLQALKEMNGSLFKIVSEVRTGTDTIATASDQIAAGNMDLS
ncbi:cache domain-containing protein, partial [Noviherbaspirillum massiliense]|uniref:cache domain-containing protein n=1 Tax=Noviherbaspirillum massiliense TaxID=1465823 RepID=UPI00047523FB